MATFQSLSFSYDVCDKNTHTYPSAFPQEKGNFLYRLARGAKREKSLPKTITIHAPSPISSSQHLHGKTLLTLHLPTDLSVEKPQISVRMRSTGPSSSSSPSYHFAKGFLQGYGRTVDRCASGCQNSCQKFVPPDGKRRARAFGVAEVWRTTMAMPNGCQSSAWEHGPSETETSTQDATLPP